uniref:Uncharacterized protein n=1 Tax=Pelusios castaneus TaxID=367368 RepID=A0A8C8RGZ1_9SAUR
MPRHTGARVAPVPPQLDLSRIQPPISYSSSQGWEKAEGGLLPIRSLGQLLFLQSHTLYSLPHVASPAARMALTFPADVNEALRKGDFNLLKEQVESGADVNRRDREGRTPLMNCCLHDGEDWALGAARLLLSAGARVGWWDQCRRNALIHAVLYQREGLVQLCLDALDCDLNHADQDGCTALWYAATSGHMAITKMILLSLKRYGLEINKANKEGLTPLMQACRQGHGACAEFGHSVTRWTVTNRH